MTVPSDEFKIIDKKPPQNRKINAEEVGFHTKTFGTIHELVSEVKAIQLALDTLASKKQPLH